LSGRQKSIVQIRDVVGFDEVADLQKMPKEVITTMKTSASLFMRPGLQESRLR
jgi:predicted ATP-dependent Lon-type protease